MRHISDCCYSYKHRGSGKKKKLTRAEPRVTTRKTQESRAMSPSSLLRTETDTADWYVHHCLPKVFELWYQRRPKTGLRGLFIPRDNDIAHTAATTVDFLNESEVQLQPHPPYSPDLSPCDLFLSPEVKKRLKGTLFETVRGARRAFTRIVEDISQTNLG